MLYLFFVIKARIAITDKVAMGKIEVHTALAETPEIVQEEVVKLPQSEQVRKLITEIAIEENMDAQLLLDLAECESSFIPSVIGDYGTSYGLYQIHCPSGSNCRKIIHPDVSVKQALDADFSIRWTIRAIKSGYLWWWSCAKIKNLNYRR